jgi:hypothetical protein
MEVNGHSLNAVLDPYNPIPIEADESRSAVDPCIFKGKLDTDDQSQVLVTGGCPGEDSFEVSQIKIGQKDTLKYYKICFANPCLYTFT